MGLLGDYLGPIHHELHSESLLLRASGSSNILLNSISFNCLIETCSGQEIRDYLTFDLRIPGANTSQESVFSYDMIVSKYGSQSNLHTCLEHFYTLGRALSNKENATHGMIPDYASLKASHDQFVRHTEQLLVAYLALPEASRMLLNRLKTEIRAKYPDADSVKIYTTGLHLDSTKTCCSPCEYVLMGLMNDRQGIQLNQMRLGFLPNFEAEHALDRRVLKFRLPKRSLFRMLVTVTANDPDSNHRKQPKYKITTLTQQECVPPYLICVKTAVASSHIFTSRFTIGFDRRTLPEISYLSDKTVGISGSKSTTGSPGTISRVRRVRDEEIDRLSMQLSFLKS